jgi:hypothetical protein
MQSSLRLAMSAVIHPNCRSDTENNTRVVGLAQLAVLRVGIHW